MGFGCVKIGLIVCIIGAGQLLHNWLPWFASPLVASMVCFSPSLFSNLYLNYQKPIWVFSHFIRYLQSLLEQHLKFCTFFVVVFLGVIVFAGTSWKGLYNGETWCCATCTCKLYFNLLAILNKPMSNLVAEKA